jgi:hypothetical protein
MPAHPPVLPPVRLLPADVLARQALAAPLLDRALRLARWTGPARRVDGMGELLGDELPLAAAELDLPSDEGLLDTAQAWGVAVDIGLVALEIDEEAEESTPPGEPAGRAVRVHGIPRPRDGADGPVRESQEMAREGEFAEFGGDPHDVLDLWLGAAETALADATAPDLDDLPGAFDGDGGVVLPDEADWEAEQDAELLDAALVNLYALTALDAGPEPAPSGAGVRVPLPVLAASLVVPDDTAHPDDAMLEEITAVMLRLDDAFRLLEPTGLIAYEPLDEALVEEDEAALGAAAGLLADHGHEHGHEAAIPTATGEPGEPDEEEIARYGAVRLTALGVYGVRERLVDAGAHAPVLGDLADASAADLLDALPDYPEHALRAEAELWTAQRKTAEAARELLAASRGDDPDAPSRRLACQQALTLLGPEAEPAVREVLDDLVLGGLARVWLSEAGAADVPAPTPEMVLWLTIDTLAAQLAADEDPEVLIPLVSDLLARDDAFLEAAWRVDHPATASVLEAMGRLHPDRTTAKQARKAAFKARSR